jgi:asparagine synthase
VNPLQPTPLEKASGVPCGEHEVATWPPDDGYSPREALERSVLDALRSPPCFVTFSGGRDSSAVLALAASVARREGLEPPIPLTHVFPGRPETDESDWQRQVLDHVGLGDWQRIEFHEELDLVGPVAGPILRRHGVLLPANCHFHAPALEAARGGTLLTGWGGDDVFAHWPFGQAIASLRGRTRPRLSDLRRLAVWGSPSGVRRALIRRFGQIELGWLTPAARATTRSGWAAEYAEQPRDWRHRLRWLARRRYLALGRHGLEAIARDAGAGIGHPFLEPRFLVALSRAWGRLGPPDRTWAMENLFGDLLPRLVLSRRSKAWFGNAFVTETTLRFVHHFDGAGLDHALVDPEALRRVWQRDDRVIWTATLIQALWLASGGDGGQ